MEFQIVLTDGVNDWLAMFTPPSRFGRRSRTRPAVVRRDNETAATLAAMKRYQSDDNATAHGPVLVKKLLPVAST